MGLLRFLFALSVITVHSGYFLGLTFVGGKIAVQSFFILSGFFMAFILTEKYVGENKSYWLFVTNRILRIYPGYIVVLLISFFLSLFWLLLGESSKLSLYDSYHVLQNLPLLLYFLLSQIFVIGSDLVMFVGLIPSSGEVFFTSDYLRTRPVLHDFMLIPQAWTLSIEFIFYFLAPFFINKHARFLMLAIILSLGLRFFLYSQGFHGEPWSNRFLPTELLFFLLGVLSYKVGKRYLQNIARFKKTIVLCYIAFIVVTIFYSSLRPVEIMSINVNQGIYFGALLVGIPFVFAITKNNVIDRFLGRLSYPVYIVHVIAADILVHLGLAGSAYLAFVTALFSVLFSIGLMVFIEKPIDRYRQNRINKTVKGSRMKTHAGHIS